MFKDSLFCTKEEAGLYLKFETCIMQEKRLLSLEDWKFNNFSLRRKCWHSLFHCSQKWQMKTCNEGCQKKKNPSQTYLRVIARHTPIVYNSLHVSWSLPSPPYVTSCCVIFCSKEALRLETSGMLPSRSQCSGENGESWRSSLAVHKTRLTFQCLPGGQCL